MSFNYARWLAGAVAMVLAAAAALATTVRPPDFDQLVGHADTILQGEVTAVRSEWTGEGERRRIVTHVTVRIAEALVGESHAETIELTLLGGQVGAERLTVAGMPEFRVGDRDILFVQGNGRQLCPLVAMGYGRYLVADDPAGGAEPIIARVNGVPLTSVDEVGLPLVEGAPAQMLRTLKRGQGLRASEFAEQIRTRAQALGRKDVHQARLK
ncbi:MAG TPA: hypothetical protein VGD81_15865 [Opitutaceae bacterium]